MKMLGSDAQRKGSASASSTVDESAIQEGEPSASPTQRRATDTENISPTPSSSDTNTVTNEAQDRHSQSSVDTDTEIPSRHAALAHLTNRTRERLRSMANREQSSSSFNAALTHRRRSSAGEPIVERETDSEDLPSQPPSEPQETSPALVELSTPPESSDIASAPAEPSTPPENSITAFVIAESSTSPESSITASAPVEPSTSPENSSNTASPPVEPSIAPESNNTASTLAGTSTSLESSNIASVPADPPTYDESVNAASAPQSRDTSRRTTPFHSSQPSESTPPTTAGPSRRQSLSHDRLEDLRSALVNTQPPPVTPPVTNEDLEQREVRSTPPQNPLDIFENLPPPLDVQASIDEVLAQNRVETQHFAPQQVAAGTQAPPGVIVTSSLVVLWQSLIDGRNIWN